MKSPAAGGGGARSTDFVHSGINGRNTTAGPIAQALGGFRNGNGFLCHCPVPGHGKGRGDRNPSLSMADGDDGKRLVHCFAGCDSCDVLAALRSRGLLDDRKRAIAPSPPLRTSAGLAKLASMLMDQKCSVFAQFVAAHSWLSQILDITRRWLRPLQAKFRCRLPWRRSLSSLPRRWPPALMRT
jgi:hypothetical protein